MKNLLTLLLTILLIGCSKEETPKKATQEKAELVNAYGMDLWAEKIDGRYIHQGDIILDTSPVNILPASKKPVNKSAAIANRNWPGGIVYWDSAIGEDPRILAAMSHWEKVTPLKFVKRTDQANYIYFISASGCYSYVGMIGGRQSIGLSKYCSTGNTIHEIGHAIGLWHEQSRADRDNHIIIHWGNIQDGREYNFYSYTEQRIEGFDLTSYLDFESIMMYSSYSFSNNGKPTITKLDGSTYSVQRNYLSNGDIEGVNKLYADIPEYENGKYYTIAGVTVLRLYDKWYYNMGYWGWKRVVLIGDIWYFA